MGTDHFLVVMTLGIKIRKVIHVTESLKGYKFNLENINMQGMKEKYHSEIGRYGGNYGEDGLAEVEELWEVADELSVLDSLVNQLPRIFVKY